VILGFSDARITVAKRGDASVTEQGKLCQTLGERIAPKVVQFLEDGYEMEMLRQPPGRGVAQLYAVYHKLSVLVWTKPSVYWDDSWLTPLRTWARLSARWLDDLIVELYPTEPMTGYTLIHGDPCMSNVMYRGDELIITDPMPRMQYRREIPCRPEVDWGKLVQSTMGWEYMLGCPDGIFGHPEHVLDRLESRRDKRLALLWGAIHAGRVARRAPGKGREDIKQWGETTSRRLGDMCSRL
jgi:hypothetical protein